MKTSRSAVLFSSFIAAASMLASTQAISAPGKGWDTFNSGSGDPIVATPNTDSASNTTAGKGWDAFRMGMGQPIPDSASVEKSQVTDAGKGWDTFNMGLGQKL